MSQHSNPKGGHQPARKDPHESSRKPGSSRTDEDMGNDSDTDDSESSTSTRHPEGTRSDTRKPSGSKDSRG